MPELPGWCPVMVDMGSILRAWLGHPKSSYLGTELLVFFASDGFYEVLFFSSSLNFSPSLWCCVGWQGSFAQ